MIRKYLILDNFIYLTAVPPSAEVKEKCKYVELFLPLEIFWSIEEDLKKAEYLAVTNQDTLDQMAIYKKVYKQVAQYIVTEADRIWFSNSVFNIKKDDV